MNDPHGHVVEGRDSTAEPTTYDYVRDADGNVTSTVATRNNGGGSSGQEAESTHGALAGRSWAVAPTRR
jgi:hypothetical protein